MGKLFGTDGVRGIAGKELSCSLATKIGTAVAVVLANHSGGKAPRILIGRDTRISGQMLESALIAGLCCAGANCFLAGIVATPAISFLAEKHGFDAGLMISASHNPFEFNGIKIFNSRGLKLSDELELEIENFVLNNLSDANVSQNYRFGQCFICERAVDDYVDHVVQTVDNKNLNGIRVAVDCANGSACSSVVELFKKLQIDAEFINISPDGYNINLNCGSTHIEKFASYVKSRNFDLGVAFDGDADRCLAVSSRGEVVDGDQLLAIFASKLKKEGKLQNNTMVVTVMSNLGVFKFAKDHDINLEVTKVGDRNVLQNMLKNGHIIGGEQSGHIIFKNYAKTGDGQLTAVQLINCIKSSGVAFEQLAGLVQKFPQVLVNVKANRQQKDLYFKNKEIEAFVAKQQEILGQDSRILVRCSGTEPLIRIMIEGPDKLLIKKTSQELIRKIEKAVSL